jgi:hypothetical protein
MLWLQLFHYLAIYGSISLKKKGRKETADTVDTVLNSSKTALIAAGTRYDNFSRFSISKNHSSY